MKYNISLMAIIIAMGGLIAGVLAVNLSAGGRGGLVLTPG